jgi:hypothetical protein
VRDKKSSQVTTASALKPVDQQNKRQQSSPDYKQIGVDQIPELNVLNEALNTQQTKRPATPGKSLRVSITK